METPHYVVGHRNPDTDTIVSAHVLAWSINESRDAEVPAALPIRLGDPNPQTKWLFEKAGVPLPIEKLDCRITVGDIASPPVKVHLDAPLSEALELIKKEPSRLVGIVDSDEQLRGVLGSRTPRINQLLQSRVEDFSGTLLDMELLRMGLGLTELRPHNRLEQAERLVVAATSEERLQSDIRPGDIVICGFYPKCLELADRARAKAVICCTNQIDQLEDTIGNTTIPIYHFPESIIALVGKLPGSVPCWTVMEETYGTIEVDTVLADSRKRLAEFPDGLVATDGGTFVGTFHQHHLLTPPRPLLSLVDHFEKAQSIDGFDDALIVRIVDHHRIGDIETEGPLEIDCRQWGSTASILYARIQSQHIEPPQDIATLLLGALLSDTLGLRSPTTTHIDKTIADELASLAGVELDEFTPILLQKNDQVATANPHQLLQADCKPFTYGDIRFLVSQIETVDLTAISDSRETELTNIFRTFVEQQAATFGVLMLTDVLQKKSLLRLVSRDEKWQRLLVPDSHSESEPRWMADDWVSRKQQVIPFIMQRIRTA